MGELVDAVEAWLSLSTTLSDEAAAGLESTVLGLLLLLLLLQPCLLASITSAASTATAAQTTPSL